MSEWSENKRYKNPDITGLVDNVKRMMGVDSGAAGRRSRNMSDFLTTSKTEGQQLKNIGQQHKNVKFKALADVIQRLILDDSLSDKEQYSMFSGTGSGDIETGYTKSALRPSVVRKSEAEAGVAEHDLGKEQAIKMIRERLMNYQPPEPELGGDRADADWVRSARSARQGAGRELNERDAQLYNLLTKGNIGTGADPTGKYTKAEHEKEIEKDDATISYRKARELAVNNLGEKNVALVEERINSVKGLTDIRKKKIINEILNDVAELDQKILTERGKRLTEKERMKLVKERLKTEAKRLEKEGHLASIAKKDDTARDNELSFKLEKLRQMKRKATSLAESAASDASVAAQLNQLKVEIAELDKDIKTHGKGKAKAQEKTAESKQEMASMDLAGYKEKLKNLKEQREDLLAKGKILLENAKTEKQRKELDLKIKKELGPHEKEIKDLAIEMAKVNIMSKSRESLTKTPSPSEEERAKQLKLEQIEAKKRTGTGTDSSAEALIKKRLGLTNGEGTSTTGGLPAPVSKKSMPPDPVAKSIFNDLMSTVDPAVLKSWTPEEIDKAVAMIQEQHPNMNEERIRRLINTAQRRSQE